jgi:hypothetical protein
MHAVVALRFLLLLLLLLLLLCVMLRRLLQWAVAGHGNGACWHHATQRAGEARWPQQQRKASSRSPRAAHHPAVASTVVWQQPMRVGFMPA